MAPAVISRPFARPASLPLDSPMPVSVSTSTSASTPAPATVRILSLSHQLPFTAQYRPHHAAAPWVLEPRLEHAALNAGVAALVDAHPTSLHIGMVECVELALTESSADGAAIDPSTMSSDVRDALENILTAHNCIPVWPDQVDARRHYAGYCKKALWPLLHYRLWDTATDGREELADWDAYNSVCRVYAEKCAEVYQSGDLVWIHDYHLCSVPALLRAMRPYAAIGFFLHSPFPSSEVFRCLPKRTEILEGILAADLVGFQTYADARHFLSCCTRVLGLESAMMGVDFHGHAVSIAIIPVGINVEDVQAQINSDAVQQRVAQIKQQYAGKRILVGRDFLDRVHGVTNRLAAFERYLQHHPDERDNVVLLQISAPRHTPLDLERQVADLVARINSQYGSLSHLPCVHYAADVSISDHFALLAVADVALITCLRDGMSTIGLQYVVTQQDRHGMLVLSEFTGTAGSLYGALHVNPWNVNEVADAIKEALETCSEVRAKKHKLLFDQVISNTSSHWAASLVAELQRCARAPEHPETTPPLNTADLAMAYQASSRRLLMFDYDGTLTPIRRTPREAIPSSYTLDVLLSLCKNPQNSVWIVSGRDQRTLETWLGYIPNLGLSAEHGCFMRYPGQDDWINLTDGMDMSWMEDVIEIFKHYTERTQGSFIERKQCSITWHYRLADPLFGAFQAKECQNHLEESVLANRAVEIITGKRNLEVRPVALNKGGIVQRLVAGAHSLADGGDNPFDMLICAGDDRTDEDMFRVLQRFGAMSTTSNSSNGSPIVDSFEASMATMRTHASSARMDCWCITVGPKSKKTLAGWHVQTPYELLNALDVCAKGD